ncbi:MAG: hypothetical protein H7098_06195 [Oligoflexus sp.]|nr:hypothetical protein [Pseudopedobacter sp.]
MNFLVEALLTLSIMIKALSFSIYFIIQILRNTGFLIEELVKNLALVNSFLPSS